MAGQKSDVVVAAGLPLTRLAICKAIEKGGLREGGGGGGGGGWVVSYPDLVGTRLGGGGWGGMRFFYENTQGRMQGFGAGGGCEAGADTGFSKRGG